MDGRALIVGIGEPVRSRFETPRLYREAWPVGGGFIWRAWSWSKAAWQVRQGPTDSGQSQMLDAAERVPTADSCRLTVACIESLDGDVLSGNVGT